MRKNVHLDIAISKTTNTVIFLSCTPMEENYETAAVEELTHLKKLMINFIYYHFSHDDDNVEHTLDNDIVDHTSDVLNNKGADFGLPMLLYNYLLLLDITNL